MKKRMSQIIRIAVAAFTFAAMPVLTSCVSEDMPDCPAKPGVVKGDVWLSVDIRNLAPYSGAYTRADGPTDADGHPDESAIQAENYIDVNDLSVMLFNAAGELVKTFGSDEYVLTAENDGMFDKYLLKVKTDASIFDFGGAASKDFSIMIIANLNGTGTGDGTYGHFQLFSTMSELSGLHKGFPYTGAIGDEPWTPSVDDARFIPMAGTATMNIASADLAKATTESAALQLPDIYLQRAMSQVRLIDATDGKFKITSVQLKGFNTRGAYLPELNVGDAWCKSTCVLEYGTALPEWYTTSTWLKPRTFDFTDNKGYVNDTKGTYPAFGFYVPEFAWDAIDPAMGPLLQITVHDVVNNKDLEYTYRFPSKTDAGEKADFARNHIYQVVVTGVITSTPLKLSLSYGVCPWEVKETDIPDFN